MRLSPPLGRKVRRAIVGMYRIVPSVEARPPVLVDRAGQPVRIRAENGRPGVVIAVRAITLAAMREDDVAHIGNQRAEAGLAGSQLELARGEFGGRAAQIGDVVRNPDQPIDRAGRIAPRQKHGLVQAAMHLDRTIGLHAAQCHANRLSHLRQLGIELEDGLAQDATGPAAYKREAATLAARVTTLTIQLEQDDRQAIRELGQRNALRYSAGVTAAVPR